MFNDTLIGILPSYRLYQILIVVWFLKWLVLCYNRCASRVRNLDNLQKKENKNMFVQDSAVTNHCYTSSLQNEKLKI
jgi:hypothetical protein